MEVIVSPRVLKVTGIPALILRAPDGWSYCATSGAGLYMAHNGDHFVAEWQFDQCGEWRLEWQGFTSDAPLEETLEVEDTTA